MSSELVTKNDLKQILQSVRSSSGSIPAAHFHGLAPTLTAVTTLTSTNNAWYALNAFTDSSSSFETNNTEYFAKNVNGIKVLKDGYYFFMLHCHSNSASATNALECRIYNYTQGTHVTQGVQMFSYQGQNTAGWGPLINGSIASCNAGDIIIPQFARYSGTANIKPSIFNFDAICLENYESQRLREQTIETEITTFNSGWAKYSTSPIILRRYGNVVNLNGAIKNTAAVTLDAGWHDIFSLPSTWSDYFPKYQDLLSVCQGSNTNRFLHTVTIGGIIKFGRYTSGTTYSSIAAGAWFPFNITWIV